MNLADNGCLYPPFVQDNVWIRWNIVLNVVTEHRYVIALSVRLEKTEKEDKMS